jgi:transcription elongation factor
MLTVFTDSTRNTIQVPGSSASVSTEKSTGLTKLANYELYDLVDIGQGSVGCIVQVLVRSFSVLDTKGQTTVVPLQQMGHKKRTRQAVTTDIKNNQIAYDDMVRIVSGPHKGMQAAVKHIFRSSVYVFSPLNQPQIVVIRAKQCELVGHVGNKLHVNKSRDSVIPRTGPSAGGTPIFELYLLSSFNRNI